MPPPRQEMQIPIGEITTYPSFSWSVEDTGDPEIKEVVFTTIPHGKQMRFPFNVEKLQEFGEKCTAPSIAVARSLGNGKGEL